MTALLRDRQGRTWAASEDRGVWVHDPSDGKTPWRQFTSRDGLGDDDVYALAEDGRGRIWAGTCSHGVSVYNGKAWRTYDQVTGPLGAHVTALAVSPRDGSVWMGSELGLARYADGQGWRYWTRADGLPSDQITCLAFAKDGTLFVGTDCDGVAIGAPRDGYAAWRHVAGPLRPLDRGKGAGLPCGLVNALLVSKGGTVYCGTDAGLAWSADGGVTWAYRRGADWLDKGAGAYASGLVDNAKLSGLEVFPVHPRPGEQGFAIAASGGAQGRFLAPRGFVGGQDGGTGDAIDTRGVFGPAPPGVYQRERYGTFAWTGSGLTPGASYHVRLHLAEIAYDASGKRLFNVFANGLPVLERFDVLKAAGGKDRALVREFTAKADGLGRLTLSFQGTAIQGASGPSDLSEDYVTSLAEDGSGRLWVGHRKSGLEALDERMGARAWPGAKDAQLTDYVDCLLPTPDGLRAGGYGGGLVSLPSVHSPAGTGSYASVREAVFPSPAAPPSEADLRRMIGRLQRGAAAPTASPSAAFLGSDWATQGDWVGRYGRQYAVLFAARAPIDHEIISDPNYQVAGMVGPHCGADEGLRHWVHWVRTDDPRVLYDPIPGYRRESEADDHGETYPMAYEGPDVWARVTVPAGAHRLSLYFMNKDGHDGDNRSRDFLVEVKPDRKTVAEAQTAPALAQARVHSFWQGEYLQFSVTGPGSYWVRVDKNASLNAILQSVMLDRLDEGTAAAGSANQSVWLGDEHYGAPAIPLDSGLTSHLWDLSSRMTTGRFAGGLLAYRVRLSMGVEGTEGMRWRLHLWSGADRRQFTEAMGRAQASILAKNPQLKSVAY